MRFSRAFIPTLKETPAEAAIPSHILMLRAGLIRKTASGLVLWLPLGLEMLRKVESIVREEMLRAGAQEIACSSAIPAELLQETGRWEKFGEEMFRFGDRHGRQFALGPTHEEVFTDLVRDHLTSWRDFPLTLFQIGRKYRDEVRPRFGVMRGREFTMKDAYSFDTSEEGLRQSYGKMAEAYQRIFARCGLDFTMVAADSGAIGGDVSFEFMAKAATGESELGVCSSCGYAANMERFPCSSPKGQEPARALPLETLPTPGMSTIDELAAGLGVPQRQLVKTLLYRAGERLVALLLRGDHQLNEAKAARHFGGAALTPATPDEIQRATGGDVGFSGPVGLTGLPVIADLSVKGLSNVVVGANRKDTHLKNANPGRDFEPEAWADLRQAGEGDPCPQCSHPVQSTRGIEVGHIFQLGTVYSEKMQALYLDREGKKHPLLMGCYGIGIDRTLAAVIEQHHDDRGLVWPLELAPFHVALAPLNVKDTAVTATAERLYRDLQAAGAAVLYDDRDERAGVKFIDLELLGIPLRLTIGQKRLAQGEVELTRRAGLVTEVCAVDEVVEKVARLLPRRAV
jgi:prolyl-tRNA synthetase